MLWVVRLFEDTSWAGVRATFEDQFVMLGYHRDMMLLAASLGYGRHRLCIGVMEPDFPAAYYGFEPVLGVGLPRAPTLLVGHRDVFQAMFQSGG